MGEPWVPPRSRHVVSLAAVIHRATWVKMVVVAALAAFVATLVAVLLPWLPDSASEEMDRIVFTYWFATIICIGIFALVAAVIIEAVWAFRVQPDDDTDGPPIHGHTGRVDRGVEQPTAVRGERQRLIVRPGLDPRLGGGAAVRLRRGR